MTTITIRNKSSGSAWPLYVVLVLMGIMLLPRAQGGGYQIVIPSYGAVQIQTRGDAHADTKHNCSNMPPERIRQLLEQGAYELYAGADGNYVAVVTDPETGLTGGRCFYRDEAGEWKEKTAFGGDQCDSARWTPAEQNAFRASSSAPDAFYWRKLILLRGFVRIL